LFTVRTKALTAYVYHHMAGTRVQVAGVLLRPVVNAGMYGRRASGANGGRVRIVVLVAGTAQKWTEAERKVVNKALVAYLEAEKEYHDGLGECCGVTWLTSDRHGCAPRETVSRRAAGELDKLARKTERKPQAWIGARRSQFTYRAHSPHTVMIAC
jgi:hypothetical protein